METASHPSVETLYYGPRCPLCAAVSDAEPVCARCGTLVLSGVWSKAEFDAAVEAAKRGNLEPDDDVPYQSVYGGAGIEHAAFNGRPLRADIPVGRPVAQLHLQETWPVLQRVHVELDDDDDALTLPPGMRPRVWPLVAAFAVITSVAAAVLWL